MNRPNRDPGPSGTDPGTEPLPVYDVDPRTGAPVTDGESLRGGGWSPTTRVEAAPHRPGAAATASVASGASAAPAARPWSAAEPMGDAAERMGDPGEPSSGGAGEPSGGAGDPSGGATARSARGLTAAGWRRWSPRSLAVAAVAAGAALFGLGALTGHEITGASGTDSVQQGPAGQNGGGTGGQPSGNHQMDPPGQNGTSNQGSTTNQNGTT